MSEVKVLGATCTELRTCERAGHARYVVGTALSCSFPASQALDSSDREAARFGSGRRNITVVHVPYRNITVVPYLLYIPERAPASNPSCACVGMQIPCSWF